MTRVQYREIDFRFDEDIPFQFNPNNLRRRTLRWI